MEWSKIKNIILLILLTVNLFLLFMVGKREYDSRRYQQSARTAVLSYLEQNKITVSAELPPDVALLALQVEGRRDTQQEREQAQALLGGTITEETTGARTVYRGANGTLEFSSGGRLKAELEPNAWRAQDGNTLQLGLQCLAILEFEAQPEDITQKRGRSHLAFRQIWNGVPIFNYRVTLAFDEDGSLRSIDGRRMLGEETRVDNETPLTVPTVLVRLLAGMKNSGNVCSEIISITAGYEAASTLRPVRLNPVWNVITDTGEYYVNGMTGALTQLS